MKKQMLCGLLFVICLKVTAQKNPCNPTGIPYSSLPGDTTIILKGGTQITFNRCEYFDLRDCLEFDEILDQEAIVRSGFTTQDRQGNILISCGMFRIRLTPDCSGKTCFEIPVRIRIPFSINFSNSAQGDSCALCNRFGIRLFTSVGGAWSDSGNLKYKIIDLNGRKYFEFYDNCANKAYNCDCRRKTGTKVRFKAKSGQRLNEVFIRTNCPVGVLRFTPKHPPKRKIVVKLPCPNVNGNVIVSATGTGSSGETITFAPTALEQLDHGSGRKSCKEKKGKVIRRILGIFPVREGEYYKKYFVQ